MAKTEEELDELKKCVDSLRDELKELSEDELSKVAGGDNIAFPAVIGLDPKEYYKKLPK